MKSIKINAYRFEELTKPVMEKVIQGFSEINVTGKWHETTLEQFKSFAGLLGIEVYADKTYIPEVYEIEIDESDPMAQENVFGGSVDAVKFIKAMQTMPWVGYNEDYKLTVPLLIHNKEVLQLIESKQLSVTIIIEPVDFGSRVHVELDSIYSGEANKIPEYLKTELINLRELVRNAGIELNRYLQAALKKKYFYLRSDEAIRQKLVKDEYLFLRNGAFITNGDISIAG
jgi:hypothetical protein